MTLVAYERSVADLVTGSRTPVTHGEAVVRWSVLSWASLGLRQVCPLTTSILADRRRLDQAIAAHVAIGDRPLSPHAWGRAFVAEFLTDPDNSVAAAAALEYAVLSGLAGES